MYTSHLLDHLALLFLLVGALRESPGSALTSSVPSLLSLEKREKGTSPRNTAQKSLSLLGTMGV